MYKLKIEIWFTESKFHPDKYRKIFLDDENKKKVVESNVMIPL